jgi:membrane protein implicated in regulation of membrane protease activity
MPDLSELHLIHPFWLWIAFAAALLATEVATGSGWLLWPAASAAVVAVLAGFVELSLPVALLVFALLTIGSTLLARRYLPRAAAAHGHDINDQVQRLVGHHGVAVAPFRGGAGRVFVDGKEWAAELSDVEGVEAAEPSGEEGIAAGSRVEVVSVAGAHLIVRGA